MASIHVEQLDLSIYEHILNRPVFSEEKGYCFLFPTFLIFIYSKMSHEVIDIPDKNSALQLHTSPL